MREGEGDPGLYGFWPYRDRAPIRWPDGKSVAVWVSPNLEYYELDPPANPHRKSRRDRTPTWSATATATTPTVSAIGAWRMS